MEMAPALGRNYVPSDFPEGLDSEASPGPGPDMWGNAPPGEFAVAARNLRKVFPAPVGGIAKVIC